MSHDALLNWATVVFRVTLHEQARRSPAVLLDQSDREVLNPIDSERAEFEHTLYSGKTKYIELRIKSVMLGLNHKRSELQDIQEIIRTTFQCAIMMC